MNDATHGLCGTAFPSFAFKLSGWGVVMGEMSGGREGLSVGVACV